MTRFVVRGASLLTICLGVTVGTSHAVTTINFDAGNGFPPSYTEAGMTVMSLVDHLHLGDNDGDGSGDLLNHGGCCSTPYEFTFGGASIDLSSFEVVLNFGGTHTFTSSSGAMQIVAATTGTFVFPVTGWTGITSFTWDTNSNLAIDNLKFCTDAEPDTDGDGRRDSCDNCPSDVNPAQADCDGDGTGDACDGDAALDTDGDGVSDTCDNCPVLANPGQEDGDADGVGNACDPCVGPGTTDTDTDGRCDSNDNCPTDPNPGQEDSDFDGIGDACDSCVGFGLDTDGDSFCDFNDNCPSTPNPGQEDADFDGFGDACDTCPGFGSIDTDGDAVCDEVDNCDTVVNPLQLDDDFDGIGNACDPCFGFGPDGDADAICDFNDNCPLIPNPGQANHDNDSFGDACDADDDNDGLADASDNCPVDPNPGQLDSDGDTIGDACDSDDDGDGVDDSADNCPLVANGSQDDGDGDGVGDVCDNCPVDPNPAGGGSSLTALLDDLNANTPTLAALVPNRFNILEGTSGSLIIDGGNDMYDGGNVLNTNLASAIPYSGRIITAGDTMFGPGSQYFTAMSTGVFVMAASGISISTFEITGNNGADNSGNVDGTVLTTTVGGRDYTIFVKRVFNAFDPSINHIVIVPGTDPLYSHTFALNTDVDSHTISGLDSARSLFYILVARQNGLHLDDADVLALANAFLQLGGQLDTDDDGQGDVCDTDDDNDGTDDAADNCPLISNPSQLDTDGDSVGDACDSDDDNDGVLDPSDNCPLIGNPTQIDCDGDALGDACDPDSVDGDNDGVDNACDNCPAQSNATQTDADGDGIGDACDTCTGPGSVDTDGDGLCDGVDACPNDPADVCATLFGCTGTGNAPSSLYRINVATGAANLVGPMGVNGCSGLAFHPTTRQLYAVGENPDTFVDSLWTVDAGTGAATLIGPVGPGRVSDISFRSDGSLFFFRPLGTTFSVGTLGTATGAATVIGSSGTSGSGNGVAFDTSDVLFHADNVRLNTLNQTTGLATLIAPLSFPPVGCAAPKINALATSSEGTLFGVLNCAFSTGPSPVFLVTGNPQNGVVTSIGATVDGLDGIAFQPQPDVLDTYKCYQGTDLKNPKFAQVSVMTDDQTSSETIDVSKIKLICVPADTNGSGISNPNSYLVCYLAKGQNLSPRPHVEVSTQFQTSRYELKQSHLLCVPGTLTVQ